MDALRGRHWQVQDLVLSADSGASFLRPEGIEGDALELQIRFGPTDASSFGAIVRCSRDGSEGVEIAYDRAARRLGGAPLDLGEDEDLILRIYVDRSVIEAFANGRACHTARCYPEREDSLGIRVFARGGSVKVKSIDAWEMRAIR